MTPLPPTPSMSTALELVVASASHPNLGQAAFHDGRVTQPSATSIADQGLITGSQDSAWRNYWAYVVDGPNAGQERFIVQTDMSNGLLRFTQPLPFPTAVGDRYLLFRDGRWGQWLTWLNETARNIHYPLDVYVPHDPEQQAQLRYTMPDPVQRAGWLQEVLVGPSTVTYTSPEARTTRWFKVNPLNVQGDIYLVLSRPLSASQQLLLRCRPPYAYDWQTAYTSTTSVLTPAGYDPLLTPQIRPPTRLFVLGTVWRCLQMKLANLTGAARQLWAQNLERHARQYAEACSEWQIEEVGMSVGYSDDWYPTDTQSWSLP